MLFDEQKRIIHPIQQCKANPLKKIQFPVMRYVIISAAVAMFQIGITAIGLCCGLSTQMNTPDLRQNIIDLMYPFKFSEQYTFFIIEESIWIKQSDFLEKSLLDEHTRP